MIAARLRRLLVPRRDDVDRLLATLDDLGRFLRDHGESHWAEWIERDAEWIRRHDLYGVTHFLSAFGGMGSLNDFSFWPANGNAGSVEEARRLNRRFRQLAEEGFELAQRRREEERPR